MKKLCCNMQSFIFLALVAALVFSSIPADYAYSQSNRGTIKGKVIDAATNGGLVNTNVIIKDTRLGAATDIEGNYTIQNVPPGTYTLEASYTGYKTFTKEVTVMAGREATVDFDLAEDVMRLDEVVVTGMGGTQIKKKLGVSISSVKPDEIQKSQEVNVVQALAGKSANVEIVQTSGDAGSSTNIRIRGGNSIDRNTQPLFVVDGVPIDNSLNSGYPSTGGGIENSNRGGDLNSEDIASIEILKGSAAAAIYGSRASNGVVLITTKTGKPGKTRISFKTTYGTTEMFQEYPLQRGYGQGSGGNASKTTTYSWGPAITPDQAFNHSTDVSDGGYLNEQNLTLSGGNDLTTFFLSVGRYFEKSHWVAGSDYERRNVRLKGTQVVNDQLKLTANVSYNNTFQNMIQRGDNAAGIGIGTLRCAPDFDNREYQDENGWHRAYTQHTPSGPYDTPSYDNPFWVMNVHSNTSDVDRVMGYVRVDYDPYDWINLSYTLGSDYAATRTLSVEPPGSRRRAMGRMFKGTFNIHQIDANFIATIQGEKFLDRWDWLDGTLMLGHNLNTREYDRLRMDGYDFGVPAGFNQLENTVYANLEPSEFQSQINTESYFSQVTFDFFDQLFVTGALRNDGSSTFGTEKRHWYPKTSAAWEFTKLENMPEIPYLDFGKIRFAYGAAGVQPGVYTILSNYTTGSPGYGRYTDASLTDSWGGQAGFRSSSNLGNSSIKPERTREFEYGLDLAFWDNRIGLEMTYYDQRTSDIIFNLNVAPSRGFFSQERNAATITNKGLEVAIDVTPYRAENFAWDTRFIWGTNENMVVSMSGASWENLGGASYVGEGHALGEFRTQSFIRFGHGIEYDIDGDGTIDDIDEMYAGQWNKHDVYVDADGQPILSDSDLWTGKAPIADWTGSIRNEFTFFKNFRFGAFIDIVNDRYMENRGKGQLYRFGTAEETLVRGTEAPLNDWFRHGEKAVGPGATNGIAKPIMQDQSFFRYTVGYSGDRFGLVENAGYIKLRELSFSYNLRNEFLRDYGISDVEFIASGRNLWMSTDYTGWDPDSNRSQGSSNVRGVDYFNSPQIKAYNFTMRINF